MIPDQLPHTHEALVLRTDFSDPAAWSSVCDAIQNSPGMFKANVEFVSDPRYEGLTALQLTLLSARSSHRSFMFVVDHVALTHTDHPILVVDLFAEPGRTFRVVPSAMWSVENNLSLANMDFAEFADSVDKDGIFRGLPEPDQ